MNRPILLSEQQKKGSGQDLSLDQVEGAESEVKHRLGLETSRVVKK